MEKRAGILVLTLVMALTSLAACSDAAANSPLENARSSKEAVARALLEAVEDRDTAAIRALVVTREEYEELIWPELPDRDQMPFDFAWSLNRAGSRKGIAELVDRLGGAPLALESFHFDEDPEVYAGFTLHRGARVLARRGDTGAIGRVPSLDVLVEYGGGWKLMNVDRY